jgi:pilus assembly protein Flp/PilA
MCKARWWRAPQGTKSEKGATALEYALMASLIAVVIVGAVTAFGLAVEGLFDVPWP